MTKRKRPVKPVTKSLSWWQKFKNFAFTFELTPKNVGKALDRRKKVKGRRKKVKITGRRLIFFFILSCTFLYLLVLLFKNIPSPTKLSSGDFPVSTQILDRNGNLLYEIYADQNRTPVNIDALPAYILQATISIEDKNYYRHFGIDLSGIVRAVYKNFSGQRLEGGSTITQQLIKMTLLNPKRTLARKVREGLLAIVTEIIYSKKQILEMYLNHAPYGGTAYGIEQAAKLYFGKSAKNLRLSEASLLAGLPQAPTTYSPFGSHPENAKDRQLSVLRRMREDGYISKQQEEEAATEELLFSNSNISIKAPHFVLWVKDLLEEQFGQKTVELGGLRVTTTLDLSTQNMAQLAVTTEVNKLSKLRVGNGAALVTNPGTGEILSMVGSKDYFGKNSDGNVNVAIRPRQPGSSIKPVMYASGFSTGKLTPSTMWIDTPTCFKVPNQPEYCPKNYDGQSHGPVQIRLALGNSYNIPAVKSLAYIGLEDMIATASAMGISTFTDPSRYGLSLTLGGGEVTMIDMATAFGTLANNGMRVPLNPFLKIEDYRGKIFYQYSEEDRRQNLSSALQAIPAQAAYLVSHILSDNSARTSAFGPASQLVIPNQVVSVKTGTTNDLRDNWTIGYTPERLTAVWVGNNDNKPMNQALVSGITGAAPIWHDIMTQLLKNRKPVWPNFFGRNICLKITLPSTAAFGSEKTPAIL
ncbi:transglycosylase domain-containing protein [Candidatus Collierbacteria bacterium]|nr:transglycosylase domain-containing protein [Candidatus Collierbacteria bacterium]